MMLTQFGPYVLEFNVETTDSGRTSLLEWTFTESHDGVLNPLESVDVRFKRGASRGSVSVRPRDT
jgi:hypothetical protein